MPNSAGEDLNTLARVVNFFTGVTHLLTEDDWCNFVHNIIIDDFLLRVPRRYGTLINCSDYIAWR
jgi:hypothetical protein